jgi:Zn-dependent oligopeptidase
LRGEGKMFKKITKEGRKTNLEKAIESVLEVMLYVKPNPNEDNRTNLEKEIDSVLKAMSKVAPESDEYANMVVTLEKLCKAKEHDVSRLKEYSNMIDNLEKLYKAKDSEKSRKISPDTIAIIVGNLLGIGLILGYEKANVITSKAVAFVLKGRV